MNSPGFLPRRQSGQQDLAAQETTLGCGRRAARGSGGSQIIAIVSGVAARYTEARSETRN
jgi:hypothetical protein